MHRIEQLSIMRSLGLNIKNKTYEGAVDVLVREYIEVCEQLEQNNKDRFRQEINRLLKPTN